MAATWQNCLVNTSDVKELTPEFFYLPDFLRNADGFCLGQRQVLPSQWRCHQSADAIMNIGIDTSLHTKETDMSGQTASTISSAVKWESYNLAPPGHRCPLNAVLSWISHQ